MFTQRAQSSAPEASKTERPRSRKLVAVIAGTVLAVILAATGVYFVAFRSLPTTVSWAPSVSAMASGDNLTVSGQIRPVGSGRQVLVQSAPTPVCQPWVRHPLPDNQ